MDGLVSKGVTTSDKIACADPYIGTVEKKAKQGYFASQHNADILKRNNDVIIICVKPQYVVDVCKDIIAAGGDAVIISVAAGITLQTLQDNLPARRVVRVMPNTACLVGESASGYALGSLATEEDKKVVETIFGSVGLAVEQKEDLLNAVTGVSGSGPAYVFEFIEALADGTLLIKIEKGDYELRANWILTPGGEFLIFCIILNLFTCRRRSCWFVSTGCTKTGSTDGERCRRNGPSDWYQSSCLEGSSVLPGWHHDRRSKCAGRRVRYGARLMILRKFRNLSSHHHLTLFLQT